MLAAALALSACVGGADLGSVEGADGTLDCAMAVTTSYEPTTGERTPFDAMLGWATDALGIEQPVIHVLDARSGTVVVGDAEIALITVDELADETFGVIQTEACEPTGS